ncbi:MAG: Mrp/NBP35 family ATP-binding protein [Actinomycetota bacterium]
MSTTPTTEQVMTALQRVNDPEIKRPITDLDMVKSVDVDAAGRVRVEVFLTVSGCPLKDTIIRDVTSVVADLDGVTAVDVELDVMSDEQRTALKEKLRGGRPEREIPFAKPDSLTKVFAVASGKGGVGKSSVTANIAAAMAHDGVRVGLLDADIYGHSAPRMLGVEGSHPTIVEQMIMPVPAHGVKVISTEMFKPDRDAPVAWRGPMLHRALQQFLSDVFWGDLDVLLLDLPPGTGDVAISLAQLLPSAEILVVTTPQLAASEVAERAGLIALQTHQQVAGVIENMSFLPCPHCGPEHRLEIFGSGGGAQVAAGLSRRLGAEVPLLGEVPLDERMRVSGDAGLPFVVSEPDAPASVALRAVATSLSHRQRGLAGRSLDLTPTAG